MRAHSRINVANNAQYHQDLADHYAEHRPEPEAEGQDGEQRGEAGPSENDYLAALHAEVAQQLRDVLGTGAPPDIIGTEPPVTRKVQTVRIERPRPRANAVG